MALLGRDRKTVAHDAEFARSNVPGNVGHQRFRADGDASPAFVQYQRAQSGRADTNDDASTPRREQAFPFDIEFDFRTHAFQ